MKSMRFGVLFALLGLVAVPAFAVAQDATPEPAPPPPGEVVANGLMNPRGFTWDANGVLYVALAGNGNTTGSVVKIENGAPVTVVDGLPSDVSEQGSVEGAADVAFLNGELYVLVEGGGLGHRHPRLPAGVYKAQADGGATLVADLSTWIFNNPTASPPDHEPYGNPFKMIAGPDALWVVIANPDSILKVTAEGEISRVADLTVDGKHDILTGLAVGADGSLYVSALSPWPYEDGTAKVFKVAADGTVSDAWTNLTAATDVVVGPDGTLYATLMTTGNTMESSINPGSGKLVKQTGPDASEDVAPGINMPIALRIGADGAFYVAGPAISANDATGWITKIAMT